MSEREKKERKMGKNREMGETPKNGARGGMRGGGGGGGEKRNRMGRKREREREREGGREKRGKAQRASEGAKGTVVGIDGWMGG